MHPLLPITLLLLHLTLPITSLNQCDKKTACSCTTENGDIDLSPLKLTPPRSIAGASIGETFYWQPCDNFDMGTETSVGCVQETAGGYFPIGTNTDGTTASGISNDGKAQFIMIAADGLRLMTLACNCDETQEFVAAYKGETPPTNPGDPIGYGFDLTSKYCCPSTGPPPTAPPGPDGPGGSTGVSTGTIVTIGFFCNRHSICCSRNNLPEDTTTGYREGVDAKYRILGVFAGPCLGWNEIRILMW